MSGRRHTTSRRSSSAEKPAKQVTAHAESLGRVRRLRRAELPRDTVELARFLIGKTLVRELRGGRICGRIVETEAYLTGDAAAHSFRGLTKRNRSLFLERGHAYVYFVYGSWYMMNVSGNSSGVGEGVLLRALEPLAGIEMMRRPRGRTPKSDITTGPGRLATALGIDRRLDGVDLCADGPLWLGAGVARCGEIGRSVRIGLSREKYRLLRFYERGNRFVSGPKSLRS